MVDWGGGVGARGYYSTAPLFFLFIMQRTLKRETISLQTRSSADSYFKVIQAVSRARLLHA